MPTKTRSEEILGTDGDALAVEILMDPNLTPAQRDEELARVARAFTAAVVRKVGR